MNMFVTLIIMMYTSVHMSKLIRLYPKYAQGFFGGAVYQLYLNKTIKITEKKKKKSKMAKFFEKYY